jgi:hypothetical protein
MSIKLLGVQMRMFCAPASRAALLGVGQRSRAWGFSVKGVK